MKTYLSTILVLLSIVYCTPVYASELPNDPDLVHKIDQMIIIGFRGTTITPNSDIATVLESSNVGGVILFDYDSPTKRYLRNITNPTQTKKLISDLQQRAQTPLFISVDEEGGYVNRLKKRYGFRTTLPTATTMATWTHTKLRLAIRQHGRYLKSLGFNINFSPVVDIAVNPRNTVIVKYGRALGTVPTLVAQKASIILSAYRSVGIITSIKHYPGHGNSTADSHKQFVDITKTHTESEYEPYISLCSQGAPMVMLGHLFDSDTDPLFPASLSRQHVQHLKSLGCDTQLIISDDYDMGAIRDQYTLSQIVANAINAGVDVLLFSNNIQSYDNDLFFKVRNAIIEGVKNGTIDRERIDDSYQKILQYKQQYSIITNTSQ